MPTFLGDSTYMNAPPTHRSPLQSNDQVHQANVCVILDRFETGTAEITWIKKNTLLQHKSQLSMALIDTAGRELARAIISLRDGSPEDEPPPKKRHFVYWDRQ